ncbi:MAG: hypothetical protein HFJ35_02550 [Clostridia bacterium]|nr:hypothetical protein [Clostridia bacterium]
MQQLKLIKGGKKTINYADIYLRLFDDTLNLYAVDIENKENLKRLAYYGVKAINEISKTKEDMEYEQILKLFEFSEVVKTVISLLTPNELITVFPIEKRYDGEKYQIKDYFFTMEELQKIGMNKIIANKIENLLWDYENIEIREFLANSLTILSDINKMETGESIMERWAKENNINTYRLYKDKTTNKKYLYDQKGNQFIVKDKIPKYLKVIDGGQKCNI